MRQTITLLIFSWLFILNNIDAQLSFYNKISPMQGDDIELLALNSGFMVFHGPYDLTGALKLKVSRFDECGRLLWNNEYFSGQKVGNTGHRVISDGIYLYIMTHQSPANSNKYDGLTLTKMDFNGEVLWAKNITTDDTLINTEHTAMFFNYRNDIIYFITGYDTTGTLIMSFDPNGTLLDSKVIEGIRHGSSLIDDKGDVVIFSPDSLFVKIHLSEETVDTVVWVRHLHNRYFPITDSPLAGRNETGFFYITVVADSTLKRDTIHTGEEKVDTTVFRLITIDESGERLKETEGFISPTPGKDSGKIELATIPLRSLSRFPVYVMIENKVLFFNSIFQKYLSPKIYEFAKDTFRLYSNSLDICMDNTLLMTGFCYPYDSLGNIDTTGNSYMFVSKTQKLSKKFIVEAEEPECLDDKIDDLFINMGATIIYKDSIILLGEPADKEISLEDTGFDKLPANTLDEDYCGKVNLISIRDSAVVCPGQDPHFKPVPMEKGAKIEWSDASVAHGALIKPVKEGVYTATVTLCDTVKVSTFKLRFTDDIEGCVTVIYPNVFFPENIQDTLDNTFRVVRGKHQDNEGNWVNDFEFEEFEMKIFDRWGDLIFETKDPAEGWDGTYNGKKMPPGVYLYNVNWSTVLADKKYSNSHKGQVSLMR